MNFLIIYLNLEVDAISTLDVTLGESVLRPHDARFNC